MNDKTTHKFKSLRAKARWAILRDAICQNRVTSLTKQQEVAVNGSAVDSGSGGNETNEHSIHRFPGFQLLHRKVIQSCKEDGGREVNSPGKDGYDIVDYTVKVADEAEISEDQLIHIRTRERRRCNKVSIKELMSHVHYGVDNTGNTRVWDCSNVLTFLVMGNSSGFNKKMQRAEIGESPHMDGLRFSSSQPFLGLQNILSLSRPRLLTSNDNGHTDVLKVLELGAGMAALPSLALISLASSCKKYTDGKSDIPLPFIDATITDGHPTAVENNIVCANLTTNERKAEVSNVTRTSEGTSTFIVKCRTLAWKANSEGASECANLVRERLDIVISENDEKCVTEVGFDLMFVSDCTHFMDFHADLAVTIGRTLRVGGVCILCQPCRGESLSKFINLIDAMNENSHRNSSTENIHPSQNSTTKDRNDQRHLFQVDLHMQYYEDLFHRHQALVSEHRNYYDPSIHYPLVLILQKMRAYDEQIDTSVAVNHVENR